MKQLNFLKNTVHKASPNRILWLDHLRGIGIIFVMWYHLIFDIYAFTGKCPWIFAPWMEVVRDCFVMVLVLISGICCRFSRNNIKRGIICLAAAYLLTFATWVMDPTLYIRFGVLHMYGASMLLYGLLQKVLNPKKPWIWAIICIICYFALFSVSSRHIGIYRLELFPLPEVLYATKCLYWLGFPHRGFASSDYYSLIPWTFLFFGGAFLGDYVKRMKKWEKMPQLKTLSFIGRHTFLFYLVHQPLYYLVFFLLGMF